jgi:hypothetical protein
MHARFTRYYTFGLFAASPLLLPGAYGTMESARTIRGHEWTSQRRRPDPDSDRRY